MASPQPQLASPQHSVPLHHATYPNAGLRWWHLAALDGDAAAQKCLGVAYMHGEGCSGSVVDEKQGMEWFERVREWVIHMPPLPTDPLTDPSTTLSERACWQHRCAGDACRVPSEGRWVQSRHSSGSVLVREGRGMFRIDPATPHPFHRTCTRFVKIVCAYCLIKIYKRRFITEPYPAFALLRKEAPRRSPPPPRLPHRRP